MKKAITTLLLLAALSTQSQDKCKGTTASGTQCKAVVGIKNGLCYRHQPNVKHCPHTSENGKQCGMVTKDGGLCRFHNK